jgi:ATP-dependent DNA helicase RecG
MKLGAEEPEYIIHGEDIMVKFTALQSALIPNAKGSNRQDEPLDVGLDVGLAEDLGEEIVKMIFKILKLRRSKLRKN